MTVSSAATAQDSIKIGVLATFEGAFAILGDDSMRGALMAVDDFGGKVGGKKIEIVKGSSDGSPDSAVRAVRKLVEQDGVKVLVGPLSGDPYRLASELGMPPWRVQKAQKQARRWSRESVAKAMQLVATLNADVKGAAADADYALESAVRKVAELVGDGGR